MRMSNAAQTVFYPFNNDLVERPPGDARGVFINAQVCLALNEFGAPNLFMQQYFKPYVAALAAAGCEASPDFPSDTAAYDYALVALPKNVIEAQYLVARALALLKPDGLLLCAADNLAGGGRIKKIMSGFGLEGLRDASKNKARVVWAQKNSIDEGALNAAITRGEMQKNAAGEFTAQPGMFGWDKVDRGSEILLQNLPDDIKGRVADFGCGYGFLSHHLVQHYPKIKELICVDADYRAVQACAENLKDHKADTPTQSVWADLTTFSKAFAALDYIIMNPPFHEGNKTDSMIGLSFIDTAYASLRPRGKLFMVANVHLPYERKLNEKFFSVEKIFEGQGFKVYAAHK